MATATSIEALRGLLKDQASATQIAVANALGHLGPDPAAAADLVVATADKEHDVRFAAGQALVALVADREPIGDRRIALDIVMSACEETQDRAIAALVGLLSDDDASIHGDVIDCLVALGPRARVALPALERLLDDDDSIRRATAGIAFVTIGGKSVPRAIPILLTIIGDASLEPEWRQTALGKIRELDETKLALATPILIRQLAARNVEVRITAMEMLGGLIHEIPAELPGANLAK